MQVFKLIVANWRQLWDVQRIDSKRTIKVVDAYLLRKMTDTDFDVKGQVRFLQVSNYTVPASCITWSVWKIPPQDLARLEDPRQEITCKASKHHQAMAANVSSGWFSPTKCHQTWFLQLGCWNLGSLCLECNYKVSVGLWLHNQKKQN